MDAEKASCTRALMLGKKCGDQAMELWKQAAVGCTVNKRSMLVGGKQRRHGDGGGVGAPTPAGNCRRSPTGPG